MQEKYADQDEEERQLRMEILAVSICVNVAVHNSTWLLFVKKYWGLIAFMFLV